MLRILFFQDAESRLTRFRGCHDPVFDVFEAGTHFIVPAHRQPAPYPLHSTVTYLKRKLFINRQTFCTAHGRNVETHRLSGKRSQPRGGA